MIFHQVVALLAAAAVTATATAVATSPSNGICESYKIPLTIKSEDFIYALPPFGNDFDVADFIDTLSSRSAPPPTAVFAGTHNVTAKYTISATYCSPRRKTPKSDIVLVATHGLNFDRSYWDPKTKSGQYSFVDFAINQGYSVFFYDRLGVGESSRVSGYVAQLSNQVAILHKLVETIKVGKYSNKSTKPKKVVLVGHSFGSSISLATVAVDPKIADGLILTGFSVNTTYLNPTGFVLAAQPRIAAQQKARKWSHLDTGYLTPVDLYANVNTFFKKPDYDVEVARYSEKNKQPFAITELLTAATLQPQSLAFTGPAMIIAGEYDFIFCTSDCNGALEYPASLLFSKAKDFKAVSFPKAGHGLNLHLNAPGAYKEITDFLSSHGL